MRAKRTMPAGHGKKNASARVPVGKLSRGASATATSRLEAAAKKHAAKFSAQELGTSVKGPAGYVAI